MARTNIPVDEMGSSDFKKNGAVVKMVTMSANFVKTSAVDSRSMEAEFKMSGNGGKYLIILDGTNDNGAENIEVCFKKGGIFGNEDVKIFVQPLYGYVAVVDASRLKNVSGENSGKVIISSTSSSLGIRVLKMP